VRSLTFNQLVLLWCVFFVENLRVQHGAIENLLLCFADESLIKSKNVAFCLEGVAEHVSYRHLSNITPLIFSKVGANVIYFHKQSQNNMNAHQNLSAVFRALLIYSCHALESVNLISIQLLDMLTNNFPHMLCSVNLVSVLKELLRMLWNSIDPLQYDEVKIYF
jgi:hypothetical protein